MTWLTFGNLTMIQDPQQQKKEIKTIVSLNDYKLAHGIEEKKL